MTGENRPLSEVFREAADEWVQLEAAAQLLDDTKSAVMAQRQAMFGDIPVNRAEQQVKASPEWTEYIEKIVSARKAANLAKVNLEYLRMKFQEWSNQEANHRAEARL
jgi:hypothetical protein